MKITFGKIIKKIPGEEKNYEVVCESLHTRTVSAKFVPHSQHANGSV